ncbi:hypothetical protein MUY27_14310 [Mucilaginibacter sp. RS28]|uniref:YXWGXW repeat-containing protein n=1 Tax=Mucilaginibacter straminoryzae TaxID=2932774 RepID=A0A9X2BCG1_9SPHI|nr:hypothetical protein [Mucilaginibacter straminoryzae]MCJ8210887.1 hypothetical protein [Mucilaginibacter straminoryzae]
MKKLFFIAAITASFLAAKPSDAQVRLNVNVNIGSQPEWGPVGYDYAEYYYLPDIDTYYYVPAHQFVYYNGGSWVRTTNLPPRYRNYNLYNSYKVVINEPNPWNRASVYRDRYAGYRGRHDQVIIRNSREVKYKEHWDNGRHRGWDKGHGHDDDRGPGRGHGNGHGHGRH